MAEDSLIRRILNKVFLREKHVCPWWLCYAFDNMFRKLVQDPEKILKSYIQEGNTTLDIGCGMGYFTIALARMVGEKGRVIAVDIQKEMLSTLEGRAKRARIEKRIVLQLNTQDSLRIESKADFALAFWMFHEVPDPGRFLEQIKLNLKSGALFLMVEPMIHVNRKMFDETVRLVQEVGFTLQRNPHIFLSHSALFSAP